MKAIHLAAGQGSRLRPLTDDRPKPLVTLGGMSLLERNVRTLRSASISDQLVVTGYEAEQIERLGYDTVHNEAYDETEMVYSLFRASHRFPDGEGLLISYGDIVYEESVVESLSACDAPFCVVVDEGWRDLWEKRFDDPLDDAETLRIEDGYLTEIGADPESYHEIEGQYVGLMTVREDYVERFVEAYDHLDRESIHMTQFIQHLVDKGWEVEPVVIDGGWVEIDTLADLETYRKCLDSGDLPNHVSMLR